MNIWSYGLWWLLRNVPPILETWLHHDDTANSSVNIASKLTERQQPSTCSSQPGQGRGSRGPAAARPGRADRARGAALVRGHNTNMDNHHMDTHMKTGTFPYFFSFRQIIWSYAQKVFRRKHPLIPIYDNYKNGFLDYVFLQKIYTFHWKLCK